MRMLFPCVALCLIALCIGSSGAQSQRMRKQIFAAGLSALDGRGTAEKWAINLREGDDGIFRGTVSAAGSPLLEHAIVEARRSGSRVVGELYDREGQLLGTVTGRAHGQTVEGRIQTVSGRSGSWVWDRKSLTVLEVGPIE